MRNADTPAMPIEYFRGLTKREAFAMRNMAALMGTFDFHGTKEDAAKLSVEWADALLAALEAQT